MIGESSLIDSYKRMKTKGKVHLVGIGGIGVSALAQLYLNDGWEVVGTNDEESHATLDRLRALGVTIYMNADVSNVTPDTTLIVYSFAWEGRAPEFMRALRELGIPMVSYFKALGSVSEGKRTIAVAGTHGKTTTTGMLAMILKEAGVSPSAIVGSIVRDFGSNYLPGDSDLFVVEACENQRHFLELSPEVLVITNLEFDHSDYFQDLADVQSAFRSLMEKVPAHGAIVTDTEHPNISGLLEGLRAPVIDYTKEPTYQLRLPGEFNLMNARAAAAAARVVVPGIKAQDLNRSLESFHGTWRRFEDKGKTATGVQVYDDYAHHPTAVRETLHALRAQTRGRVYVAFHPHLYSRTRDLLDGFARAFGEADEVLIAPIYAAREVDDGSISSEILAERIREEGTKARAASFKEIEAILRTEPSGDDVIMTMGAGDIYKVADNLVQ